MAVNKGGSAVGCFEYVAAGLLNPDEVRVFVVLDVAVAWIVSLVVDMDVGCAEKYNN